ncbi:MAG: AAA domain-containing protein, partial [Gemmatimonadota bacterium]
MHGPPGTGKTTTAIEVIRQHVERGDSVLATAASNVAVDNMLEFLARQRVPCVRVGHPARVTPLLRDLTLDRVVQDHPDYRRYEELREQAFELK